MTVLPSSVHPRDAQWQRLFWILAGLVLVLLPLLSHSYGQTGDEWIQIQYGKDIWNYFFAGDQQALDYSAKGLQFQHQEYYGGLFDFSMEALHRLLPGTSILTLRHFFNALSGAGLMIYTGLLARRLSGRWLVAVLSLLFIVFSPRIFGESMNNPKDIPFAFGFVMGVYHFLALLQGPQKRWRHCLGLALGFGIAFGVRSAGGLLQLAYFAVAGGLLFLWQPGFRERLKADNGAGWKRLLIPVVVALAGGYVLGLAAWPWGLQSPVGHPLESLRGMANREVAISVLFDGRVYSGMDLPWYYEFKWIAISNPLVVLAGIALVLVLLRAALRLFGRVAVAFLVFGALFPLLYMIYKHSTMYDTWRHVFFVYPFWVVLGALGWAALVERFAASRYHWVPLAVVLVGLLPPLVWTVRSHPNQTVYFNETVGGLKGAYGYYETDYYQNSGGQAADWIRQHAQKEPGRRVMVRSNLSNFGAYFEKDTAWLAADYGRFPERSTKDWEYFVTYSRYIDPRQLQAGAWPPKNAVHTVAVDGVPLAVVLYRPRAASDAGVAAFQALEKKDFAAAAAGYARYLQSDPNDETIYYYQAIALANLGRIDEALAAVNRARQLNPFGINLHQLAAELYAAKGDTRAAQDAQNQAAALSYDNGSNDD